MPDSRLIRRPFKMTSKSLRRERILHILIVRAKSVFYTQVEDSYFFMCISKLFLASLLKRIVDSLMSARYSFLVEAFTWSWYRCGAGFEYAGR